MYNVCCMKLHVFHLNFLRGISLWIHLAAARWLLRSSNVASRRWWWMASAWESSLHLPPPQIYHHQAFCGTKRGIASRLCTTDVRFSGHYVSHLKNHCCLINILLFVVFCLAHNVLDATKNVYNVPSMAFDRPCCLKVLHSLWIVSFSISLSLCPAQ